MKRKGTTMTDQETVNQGRAATVKVEDLEAAPWNARRAIEKDGIQELAASIEHDGLLQPLVVRGRGAASGYEVICGARRLAAVQLLNYKEVRVWIVTADDARAKVMNLAENIQRASLTALEEAAAFQKLVEVDGLTAVQIAAEIGKAHDATYVYQRLRLMQLIPKWRKELEARRISTGVALQIGRVPAEAQEALAGQYLRRGAGGIEDDSLTVREVRDWIRGNAMLALKDAPWSLADAGLPGGACEVCPKRTGAAIELFPDLAKGKDKAGDLCLDVVCWKKKEETHITLAKKRDPKLIELKGWEEGHVWKASAGGTAKGIILQEGFHQEAMARGTIVAIEMIKRNELPMVDGAGRKTDGKTLRQEAEIRRRTVLAVVNHLLIEGASVEDWRMAVKILVGRMMNDDRRGLCKVLALEAKKTAYGSPDFERALIDWAEAKHRGDSAVYPVLAVGCASSVRMVGSKDPIQAAAIRMKIDTKAIARAVREGTKTPTVKGGEKTIKKVLIVKRATVGSKGTRTTKTK
jgi:ParB family chromosome partitioning protein